MVEVANHGQFLSLFQTLLVFWINYLQLDLLHSADRVQCLVWQEPGAIINDLHWFVTYSIV